MILRFFAYVVLSLIAKTGGNQDVVEASTDTLMVAIIVAYLRIMNSFAFDQKLGPLYFAIIRMFGDVGRWLFIFVLFMIGFQLAFMALTIQSGFEPMDPYPDGSFAISLFTIIGDWRSAIPYLQYSKMGLVMLSIYALLAQIMLVNLLIAMMGDTYGNVKDNSDKEWKFSRYSLVMEYNSTTYHPPPFNLIVVPLKYIVRLFVKSNTMRTVVKYQRNYLKKKLNRAMDNLLEDKSNDEKKTIEAVGDKIQDQIQNLMSEQENDRLSIRDKFTNLETKILAEIGKLKVEQAPPALGKKEPKVIHCKIQGRDVPLTWEESVIDEELVHKILASFTPFKDWVTSVDLPENSSKMIIKSIHMQSVDMFGTQKIGFVKFRAEVVDKQGARIPGIVFMRGGAVAILVLFKSQDDGKVYAVMTVQPRVPVGNASLSELPAGMLDGSGKFVGVAAKELEEETGIQISENELSDLTGMAFSENPEFANLQAFGAYPSAGGCDEFIRLYLYRRVVSSQELGEIENKIHGRADENEKIYLKLVELDDIWKSTTDMKAMSAMFLYQALLQKGKISPDY